MTTGYACNCNAKEITIFFANKLDEVLIRDRQERDAHETETNETKFPPPPHFSTANKMQMASVGIEIGVEIDDVGEDFQRRKE